MWNLPDARCEHLPLTSRRMFDARSQVLAERPEVKSVQTTGGGLHGSSCAGGPRPPRACADSARPEQ